MSALVVHTVRLPAASSRSAVLEVEISEPGPPARWRLRLALRLIRWAGKLARMSVRIIG